MIHSPFQSLSENRQVELDPKTCRFPAEPPIGWSLGRINGTGLIHGLQIHNHRIFDYQIRLVTAVKPDALVPEGQPNLPPQMASPLTMLVAEAFLVR
jgi:hypothetical protein